MEKRVVITGMGIWSCLGTTLDEVRDSLYKGKSGIVFNAERKSLGFRSALCADVPKPDLKPFIPRNQRQFMPEEAQYAYMATRQALEGAKLDADYMEHHEVGLIYGNDSVAEATMHALDKFREFHDTAACGSGAIFQSMNSTVTMNLACLFRLKGINLTASAACASGSQSIGLAALLIRNGLQECVVCGGAQEANLYSVAAFDGIQSFSVREDHPTCASRPFDRDRDGLVPGGGAATVVLESYEHAVRRGAPIWGEIVGWGFSDNGDHISTPNIEGPVRSLEACLRNSGVAPKEIGYINAIQPESYTNMNALEFINDEYASWDITYYMNGNLLNRLPLVKKLKWREVFCFRGLWGHLTDKNNPAKSGSEGLFCFPACTYEMGRAPYMEASAGIENIFNFLRIDYVWRLNYRNHPDIQKSGIRMTMALSF